MGGGWWKLLLASSLLIAGAFISIESSRSTAPRSPKSSAALVLGRDTEGEHRASATSTPDPSHSNPEADEELHTLRVPIENEDHARVPRARWRLIRVDLDRETQRRTSRFRGLASGCGNGGDQDDWEAIVERPTFVRPENTWTLLSEGVSDSDGEIVVHLREAHRYALVAFHPEHGSSVSEVFDCKRARCELEESSLLLRPAQTIRGRVVDEHDAPISGAELTFGSESYNEAYGGPLDEWVFRPGPLPASGPSGEFEVQVNGPRFAHQIQINKPGFVEAILPIVGQEPIHVVLSRGHRLFGRVIDKMGRPVAGAALTAFSSKGGDLRQAYTDDDGAFSFEDTTDVVWQARVLSPPHREVRRFPIRPGRPNEIVLEPAGQVQLELFVDPDLGEPCAHWPGEPPSFHAFANLESLPPHPNNRVYRRWKTLGGLIDVESREGAYVFGRLEGGRYQLTLAIERLFAVRDLDVHAGEITLVRLEDLHRAARPMRISVRKPAGAGLTRQLDLSLRTSRHEASGGAWRAGPQDLEPTLMGFGAVVRVASPETRPLVLRASASYADDRLRCWHEAEGEIDVSSNAAFVDLELTPNQLDLVRTSSASVGDDEAYPSCWSLTSEAD